MKKLFLLSTLLLISLLAKAQTQFSISEGESALVYSLPKTEFCIEVETEKTTQKPGMFYKYSERYLATSKVITQEKTTFKIKSITVKTRAVADPNRTYSFIPSSNLQTSRLSVNNQGILSGVNIISEPEVIPIKIDSPIKEISNQDVLLPLGEEYMMAGSEAKLAEGAAKQIYRIRESRMGLLTADVEKLPADGESFKSMLEGMNKLEAKLNELFIGQTTSELVTQILYLTPTASINNEVLFRMSALKGIVTSEDLSGVPYYISIIPTEKPAITNGSKSKSEKGALYTVLPVLSQITIGDGLKTIYTTQFFVPQFGKTISLPESLFKQSHLKIRIDQQTGRLLSVE